jgi:hypothetical protein
MSGTLWAGARDAGLSHKYVPFDDGIYYISLPDQGFPLRYEVRFLSFATRTHQTVDKFEARSALSLSVSPDRKTFLVSGAPMLGGSDLKLIANFR